MEELLTQAKELLGSLHRKIKDNDERKERLDKQDGELVERTKDLLEREAKIKPAEDLIEFKRVAVAEKTEADAMLKNARAEREKVGKERSAHDDKLAEDRSKMFLEVDKADKRIAMAEKEWIALKKEQESWKAKFIEEIKNKVT